MTGASESTNPARGAASGGGKALDVSGVSFTYPDGHAVLREVSLSVAPGERVALLGPNGAGKTTLALHLNGVLELQQGSITVGGLNLGDQNLNEIRRRVGLVFQNADDQLFMPTVHEDVAFGPANLKLSKDEQERRAADALKAVDAVDLGPRAPHHLSGGEKRRVAMATVLSMDPEILVLDEPTGGLDPTGRRELAQLLGSLPHTQLIITHDLPFALELCPRSLVFSDGAVVADGPTAELLADRDLMERHRLALPFGFDPLSRPRA
jgi:cobalt transport protein ATP-binding subunit